MDILTAPKEEQPYLVFALPYFGGVLTKPEFLNYSDLDVKIKYLNPCVFIKFTVLCMKAGMQLY